MEREQAFHPRLLCPLSVVRQDLFSPACFSSPPAPVPSFPPLLADAPHCRIRIGSFQLQSARGNYAAVLSLAQWTARIGYEWDIGDGQPFVRRLLDEAARRIARTTGMWQVAGFLHGGESCSAGQGGWGERERERERREMRSPRKTQACLSSCAPRERGSRPGEIVKVMPLFTRPDTTPLPLVSFTPRPSLRPPLPRPPPSLARFVFRQ
jgi:hypothetical protein